MDALLTLEGKHPGVHDEAYLARRNQIASLALNYRTGAPVPLVAYGEEEHRIWRSVLAASEGEHERWVCPEILAGMGRLVLDRMAIPQLAEINKQLAPYSTFRFVPVAGRVEPRVFFSFLSRGMFLATQFVRHGDIPFFTPEPDIIHELLGHAGALTDPQMVAVLHQFGHAAQGASDVEVERLARLYAHVVEFGVARVDGKVKAFGAGLLSSLFELGRSMNKAQLLPFSIEKILQTPISYEAPQQQLFVASSYDAAMQSVQAYLSSLSSPARSLQA